MRATQLVDSSSLRLHTLPDAARTRFCLSKLVILRCFSSNCLFIEGERLRRLQSHLLDTSESISAGLLPMKQILFCFGALLFASMAKPAYADDYEIQFLAATCSLVNRADATVVVTAQGPGVQHRDGSL